MRICILTQPLKTNYGGLLQAYALQIVLKRMGHEVWTEDRRENKKSLFQQMKYNIKVALGTIRHQYNPTERELNIISQNTNYFIKKYIKITEPIFSMDKSPLEKYGFDAYIVGSDQVWRPYYSYGIMNYFLDFTEDMNVKRIAYAASFGTDEWEFSIEQTAECSRLIKKFDAISVREDSGIVLCSKHFGVKAEHLLDPTFLLDKCDYENIVSMEEDMPYKENLMTYILDKTEEKKCIVDNVATLLGVKPFSVMPKSSFINVGRCGINHCVYPRVTEWLRGFQDADFVITDSFHGTVFSIIYNKPFISIANKDRGISRFTSLLKTFNLNDRLIFSYNRNDIDRLINTPIDYEKVNKVIKSEQEKAIIFLHNALS